MSNLSDYFNLETGQFHSLHHQQEFFEREPESARILFGAKAENWVYSEMEIRQYFGPTSDADEAQKLMKQDPEKYRRMREEAKKRGLFGKFC